MTLCKHPREMIRKVDHDVWMCACGVRRTNVQTLTDDERRQIARIDEYNRAMRTAKSRRKFILTGRA